MASRRHGGRAGPESYLTLRALVERLPVMLAPSWLGNATQTIGIVDVLRYLVEAPRVPEVSAREIQIGSAEVLTYGRMLDQMADALGLRRRPRIPIPLLTPWLSSHWIGLVTPVDAGVARPLIEGLSTATTVTDPSGMALFDFTPRSFEQALRDAIAEEDTRLDLDAASGKDRPRGDRGSQERVRMRGWVQRACTACACARPWQ